MGKLKLMEVSNVHKIIELASDKQAPTQAFPPLFSSKSEIYRDYGRDIFIEKVELEFSFEELIKTA